jgi:hypothetical protein
MQDTIDPADFNHLLGKTLQEAKELCGLPLRVTIADGKGLMVTMDINYGRLNVETMGGKINRVIGLG